MNEKRPCNIIWCTAKTWIVGHLTNVICSHGQGCWPHFLRLRDNKWVAEIMDLYLLFLELEVFKRYLKAIFDQKIKARHINIVTDWFLEFINSYLNEINTKVKIIYIFISNFICNYKIRILQFQLFIWLTKLKTFLTYIFLF